MRAVSGCERMSEEIEVSVLNRKCGLIWRGERRDLRRQQQVLLLVEPVLDPRVVPDLDRGRDAEHRGHEHQHEERRRRRCQVEQSVGAEARADRLPDQLQRRWGPPPARSASPPEAAAPSARCGAASAEKTNGEKCQMASFGHSSRRPPPANPQPTANGSAPHSPAMSAGTDGQPADDGAGVRAGDQADEKRAFERQVRRVVAQQDARGDAEGERNARAPATGSAGPGSRDARRSGCGGTAGSAPASWPAAP